MRYTLFFFCIALLPCMFSSVLVIAQNADTVKITKITKSLKERENDYFQFDEVIEKATIKIKSGQRSQNQHPEEAINGKWTSNSLNNKSIYTITISAEGYIEVSDSIVKGKLKKYENGIIELTPQNSITDLEPITVYDRTALMQFGKVNLGEALYQLEPSIYHVPQTIVDLTDHIVPTTMKGLSTDQYLLLINAKRVHTSALLNVNGSVGKGYTSFDLNMIPLVAVDKVQIYRAGASVRFGSDAIAGVINIILRESSPNNTTAFFDVLSSSTLFNKNDGNPKEGLGKFSGEGDAYRLSGFIGQPFNIGEKTGQLSFSGEYNYYGPINRSSEYVGGVFKPSIDSTGLRRDDEPKEELDKFWENLREVEGLDSNRIMKIGKAETEDFSLFTNNSIALSDQVEFYTNGNFAGRTTSSFGFYRLPYQANRIASNSLYPYGFLPNISSTIRNRSITGGLKINSKDWKADISQTFSGNNIDIQVRNSNNASLGDVSPTSFEVGGLRYSQEVTNVDFEKQLFYKDSDSWKWNIQLGIARRKERYQIIAGEPASYEAGILSPEKASAAQVFPGFQPENEVDAERSNTGIYTLLNFDDINTGGNTKLYLSAGGRFEKYSNLPIDGKKNFIGRLAIRWELGENFTLRGSYNGGFRAPSLHQSLFSSTSTQIPNQVLTFNNESTLARLIGIPQLQPEQSNNWSGGINFSLLGGKISGFVDYYDIRIKDRIIFSSQVPAKLLANSLAISPSLLDTASIANTQFFLNATNTKTRGIDALLRFSLCEDKLKINLGGNLNFIQEVDSIKTPPRNVEIPDSVLFNREDVSRLEVIQPNFKLILNSRWDANENWFVGFKFTIFGYTKYIDPKYTTFNQTLSPRGIFDLEGGYKFKNGIHLTLGWNNLLANNNGDTFISGYPERNNNLSPIKAGNSFDKPPYDEGRFPYSRRTRQFLESGGIIYARLTFNL